MNRATQMLVSPLLAVIGSAVILLIVASCAAPRVDTSAPEETAPQIDAAVEPAQELPPEEPVLSVPEAYESISLYVQAGDVVSALDAYEEARLERPHEPNTRLLLANLYLIAGEIDSARLIIDEILADRDSSDVGVAEQALYLRSLVQALEGDGAAQRNSLQQILDMNPTSSQALASLGELQLEERDLEGAEETFTRALSADSASVVARIGLGNVYLRTKEYDLAEEQFTSAIETSPEQSFAYSDRALARSLLYELELADEDLSVAIELDPEYSWHYIDRGRIRMERRRYGEAAEDFAAAIELNPGSFLGYSLRARANDARDDYPAALEDYETTLSMRPDYHPAYAPTAALYYMYEQYAEAASYFEKAYEADDRRIEYILMTSLALKHGGDEQGGRDFVEDRLADFPRDSLFYTLARYYILPGNEGYVTQAIRAETHVVPRGQGYFYVGAQLDLIDRPETARATFLEAEDSLPVGIMERRLASWHLRKYRVPEEESE